MTKLREYSKLQFLLQLNNQEQKIFTSVRFDFVFPPNLLKFPCSINCSAVVEVADFNFGDVGSDMEYKSFRQRLVESVQDTVNEFRQNRNGVPSDLTGDSSVGYGSMK